MGRLPLDDDSRLPPVKRLVPFSLKVVLDRDAMQIIA